MEREPPPRAAVVVCVAVSSDRGPMSNPLLDFSALPRFDAIRPEHVEPAIRELIAENRRLIDEAVADSTPPSWDGFVAPLTESGERLGRAWGVVSHMHSVFDVP